MQYDVFNGDADGIFALHQLRLAAPVEEATLITGVKRDISLLQRITGIRSADICVLDISLDRNRDSLETLLENDNMVFYVDHHYAGDIPVSPRLDHHIEPSARICTSTIVNGLLEGKYPKWAACGAFGDNLDEQATELARSAGAGDDEIAVLRDIGELFNYNGYGARLEDLHFHPADLFRMVHPFEEPLHFFESTEIIALLKKGYEDDMQLASEQRNIAGSSTNRVYRFPDAPWARRIAGVFSNLKAREQQDGAHAVIVENSDGTLQISVRAPLSDKKDADTLCRRFPTGGGRAAAAGINHLPADMFDSFIDAFQETFTPENDS